MKIRKEQMEAFSEAGAQHFEDHMVEYLWEYFPGQCEVLTEDVVRTVIRHGMERAGNHEIETERDLSYYITLMFLLGSHFDEDPQVPWAADMLADENLRDDLYRLDRLYARAMEYLDEAAGENDEHLDELARLHGKSIDDLQDDGEGDFETRMLAQLRSLYSKKLEALGEDIARALLKTGRKQAKGHGLTADRSAGVFISLMFLLGSGFDVDPQFPWAAEVLGDRSIRGEDARTDALYAAAQAYLRRWLT